MRLVQAPLQYPPRACAVTNREDGDLIDMQVLIDRPGRLYLKREIAEEAGRLCGMVPAAEVEELKAAMAELGQKLDNTNEILQTAADLEELVGAGRN